MVAVVAIELGLAVLLAADGVVDLVIGLVGHDLAQEGDKQRRFAGINHKVGAGEAKHDGGEIRLKDDGVDIDAMAGAEQGQDKGEDLIPGPDQPHQIGPLVAVEHLFEQLDGKGLIMEYLRAVLGKMAVDVDNIPLLVLVGEGEAVIAKQLAQGLRQVGEIGAIDP